MKVIEANGQAAVVSTRTLAMVHGAVHDALNAINRKYDAYYFRGARGLGARHPTPRSPRRAHTVLRRRRQQLRHAPLRRAPRSLWSSKR